MGNVQGLQDYLDAEYAKSIFDEAVASGATWEIHHHGHQVLRARITENLIFEIKADVEGQGEMELSKVQIKCLYPADQSESIRRLIKTDKKVKTRNLEAILAPGERNHIKNKSMFPLMKDREVLFFTLLEGEVIRGLIGGFTRYDITINLKGGIPVTTLRHAVHDLRNKKGRSFLRAFQEEHRDWEKHPLFVADP